MSPQIKVLTQSYAGEDVVAQIEAEVLAKTGNANPPRAMPIRGADGKLIAVNVGLPVGVAQSTLAQAIAAVNGNSGVSKASYFPALVADYSFGDKAQDEVFPASLSYNTFVMTLLDGLTYGPAQWQGAAAGESVGSVLSALRLTDADSAYQSTSGANYSHTILGNIGFTAANLPNIDYIGAWEMEYVLKAPVTQNGVARDAGDGGWIVSNTIWSGGQSSCRVYSNSTSDYWILEMKNGDYGYNQTVITDIAKATAISVKHSYSQVGVFQVEVGAFSASFDEGYLFKSSSVTLNVARLDYMTTTATLDQRPVVIDDLTMTVLSDS